MVRSLLRGVAAGLAAVLLWHAAVLSGWLFDGTLGAIACAVATGALLLLLLRQRGLARFLLSLLCALATGGLAMWLSDLLGSVPAMLGLLAPGFLRVTASVRYAILVTSAIFFGIMLIALVAAFILRPRGRAPKASATEYPNLAARYGSAPEKAGRDAPKADA